mgnify:CR=1 FL=1
MNNQELTLLSVEQIWGNSQLEVLKKYGTKIAATDLCILTRGCVRDEDYVELALLGLKLLINMLKRFL